MGLRLRGLQSRCSPSAKPVWQRAENWLTAATQSDANASGVVKPQIRLLTETEYTRDARNASSGKEKVRLLPFCVRVLLAMRGELGYRAPTH